MHVPGAARSCEIVQTGYTGAPLSMLFPYVPRASFAIRHGGSVPETPTKVRLHLSDERRYRLLKLLCEQPQASQRQLSQALGVSVGSLNYAVNALIDRGWIKVLNPYVEYWIL